MKKDEFVGIGALVELIGVGLIFAGPIGVGAGIVLLIVGGRLAIVRVCSDCRGKVDKQASCCPHCNARFS